MIKQNQSWLAITRTSVSRVSRQLRVSAWRFDWTDWWPGFLWLTKVVLVLRNLVENRALVCWNFHSSSVQFYASQAGLALRHPITCFQFRTHRDEESFDEQLYVTLINLPANGGDESTEKEAKQLARPKADALLRSSTQVKNIRLLVEMLIPAPTPKNKLHTRKWI